MPDRFNIQCVGPETETLIANNDGTTSKKFIKDLVCLFNFNPDLPDGDPNSFERNPDYRNHHKLFNKQGNSVAPLFRYEYTEDPSFPLRPLLEITAKKGPDGPPRYILTATEWHPIMIDDENITLACLLNKGDSVLLEGLNGSQGEIVNIKPARSPKVIGLTVALLQEDNLENEMVRLHNELIRFGADWEHFDLDKIDHIIWTDGFFSGTLPVQNKLSRLIRQSRIAVRNLN
jgi:hypothetical protein